MKRGSGNFIKMLGLFALAGGAVLSAVSEWAGKKQIKEEIIEELRDELNSKDEMVEGIENEP